ncbi:universal stress protein [Streptomyces sp. NPDC053367]|uniref:universal stress protein n=1 Tax=Streptomyces sp. NPDC053367 TaxID=3365700 RepID=UPI0037D3E8AF
MSRTVTVGVDGSPESLAAAHWAAREAELRAAELRLVHAGDQPPHAYTPFGGEGVPSPGTDLCGRMLGEVAAALRHRHPALRITAEQIGGQPARVLPAAAGDAELLVLGSRGLGPAAGVLLGSMASAVVARTGRPVVLVRPDTGAAVGRPAPARPAAPHRQVVLGLDLYRPHDAVLEFAFDAASRRAAELRVVHGWSRPAHRSVADGGPGSTPADHLCDGLAETLRPWREKYPDVEVTQEAVVGTPGAHLVDASHGAALVVVGRKRRHGPLGPHLGAVAHEVLRLAAAPVAVVAHD